MTAVYHIVPTLPPNVNGLGDYALVLAQELAAFGIESGFIVAGMAARPEEDCAVGGRIVELLPDRSAEALVDTLERTETKCVLLHFSGYGYARWGICFWLLQGLTRWKALGRNRRLVTMFHELYAFGPPWRPSFWTSWPQRQIACGIAHLSDAIVCSCALVERRLHRWQGRTAIHIQPVFSNVGELEAPKQFAAREPMAVILGRPITRRRTYAALSSCAPLVSRIGIERMVDIGPSCSAPTSVAGVPVEPMGVLTTDQISQVMARAAVGVVNYRLSVAGKSGVIAAYFAHGLLCVNLSNEGHTIDNIVDGRHFVGLSTLRGGAFDAEAIAAAGHHWYVTHNRKQTAQVFQLILRPSKI